MAATVPGFASFRRVDLLLSNQTADGCKKYAQGLPDSDNYAAWGHRTDKHPNASIRNTCFLYPRDGFGPFAGDPTDPAHRLGCVKDGFSPVDGCKSATVPPAATPAPPPATRSSVAALVDEASGWARGYPLVNIGSSNQTPDDCRRLAAAENGRYAAWAHRNESHRNPSLRNTCFAYPRDGFGPFVGDPTDAEHTMGCVMPGEKLSLGCTLAPVATPQQEANGMFGTAGLQTVLRRMTQMSDKVHANKMAPEKTNALAAELLRREYTTTNADRRTLDVQVRDARTRLERERRKGDAYDIGLRYVTAVLLLVLAWAAANETLHSVPRVARVVTPAQATAAAFVCLGAITLWMALDVALLIKRRG